MLDATTIAPPTTNGLHYEPTTDPDSPLADSPDTPINTVSDVAVKISSDIPEVESDARHEPYQISLDKLDDASIPPQIDAPIVPSPSFFFTPTFLSSHRISFLPRPDIPLSRYTSFSYHSALPRRIYGRRISRYGSSTRGCRDGGCRTTQVVSQCPLGSR